MYGIDRLRDRGDGGDGGDGGMADGQRISCDCDFPYIAMSWACVALRCSVSLLVQQNKRFNVGTHRNLM